MLKRRLDWEEKAEEHAEACMSEEEQDGSSSESSDSESEMSGAEAPAAPVEEVVKRVKCMVLSGRGVNARQRHLLDDICLLLPHLKKESKFDTKEGLFPLNELAELNSCTHTLFFEPKKPQELFLWAARTPGGPSIRFHVQNIHTLDELHMDGNCMKNTRAILSFDPSFAATEEGRLMQALLTDVFTVPEAHRKTKPYFDHVFQFSMLDDRIWFRNYQVVASDEAVDATGSPLVSQDGLSLREIGPRFVLHPVRAFAGSFGGKTVYLNPHYTPASVVRNQMKHGLAAQYGRRQDAALKGAIRKQEANLPRDQLERVFQ